MALHKYRHTRTQTNLDFWCYCKNYELPRHKMEVSFQLHAPAALPLAYRVGGWGDEEVKIPCLCRDSSPDLQARS